MLDEFELLLDFELELEVLDELEFEVLDVVFDDEEVVPFEFVVVEVLLVVSVTITPGIIGRVPRAGNVTGTKFIGIGVGFTFTVVKFVLVTEAFGVEAAEEVAELMKSAPELNVVFVCERVVVLVGKPVKVPDELDTLTVPGE